MLKRDGDEIHVAENGVVGDDRVIPGQHWEEVEGQIQGDVEGHHDEDSDLNVLVDWHHILLGEAGNRADEGVGAVGTRS